MDLEQFRRIQSRRKFFRDCAGGIGTIALAQMLERDGRAAAVEQNPLAPRKPHFAPKAKNIIFMFMEGGPSQLDLFDPSPNTEVARQAAAARITKDLRLAYQAERRCLASPASSPARTGGTGVLRLHPAHRFLRRRSSAWCARCTPTRSITIPPIAMLFGGSIQVGRPTMGAWVLYGLGSESQNLPGFVVLSSGVGTSGGSSNWSSGYLPSTYQGVVFRSSGDPVLYLSNPPGVTREMQRASLAALKDLNEEHYAQTGDMEIASRISSYELGFRMQMSAPDLLDFSKESPETLAMYGVNEEPTKQFATNCLLARRMVERGVFRHAEPRVGTTTPISTRSRRTAIWLTSPPGADWDQRGLLEDTLVVWGGEFGRTPMCEIRNPRDANNAGRDHHPLAYSLFLAGGGIKGGTVVGKTDELCMNVTEDKVHVHDLQATLLHCLGLDHTRLTFHHMGRDFRLTDVEGNVVKKMLA
jgi:hypothetical protein